MADNKNPNTATLAAEIMAGDYDGDLANIMAAVVRRQQSGLSSMRWKLNLTIDRDGEPLEVAVTEDDLTLRECKTVEKLTGLTWVTINPTNSAAHMSAVMISVLVHRHGFKQVTAEEAIDGLPANTLMDAYEQYEVNPSPLESGESSKSDETSKDDPSSMSSEASAE